MDKSFSDVLSDINSLGGRKNLLLGNGFSQALRPDIFSYSALFEKADFSKLSKFVPGTFKKLKTKDFEIVIKALRDASKLSSLYSDSKTAQSIAKVMKQDATGIKKVLVKTITSNHPERPSELTENQLEANRKFLSHFSQYYSINYDLLLYWVALHYLNHDDENKRIKFNDGFVHPEGEETDYVVWEGSPRTQNAFYLHGALHIFEGEAEIKKYTWKRTGVRLKEQVTEALNNEIYPLFVSEGTSNQKRAKIIRSEYLGKGFRSLRSASGTMVTYGMSFGENDRHIMDAITKSTIRKLWVSIYGDSNSQSNKTLIKRTQSMTSMRSGRTALEVDFYQAETAQIWG